MRIIFISMLLACTLSGFAQNSANSDSVASKRGLKGVYDKVTTFFDSTRVRGHDPRYIEMPKQPWSVMVQNAYDQTDLKMNSTMDGSQFPKAEPGEGIDWNPRILTKVSTSVGAWVGYRGHGIGYAVNVGGDKGTSLTLTSTGKFYSLNFRYHTFKTDEPEVDMKIHYVDEETGEMGVVGDKDSYSLMDPIKARTLYLNGFYIFNYKRFSYAAARRQAVIQKRSAGSPIAGISFFHSKYAFANNLDADFVMMMSKVGTIRQWQASVSAGYSYNWVPAKGWLINATVLPSLTFYDKIKVSLYDSPYSRKTFALSDDDDKDYVKYKKLWVPEDDLKNIWNNDAPEAENVERLNQYIAEHKEDLHYCEPDEYDWNHAYLFTENDLTLEPYGTQNRNGRVSINFDARATVAYQWSRYFVSLYAQFDTFSYRYKTGHGHINDWSAKASFGVRF